MDARYVVTHRGGGETWDAPLATRYGTVRSARPAAFLFVPQPSFHYRLVLSVCLLNKSRLGLVLGPKFQVTSLEHLARPYSAAAVGGCGRSVGMGMTPRLGNAHLVCHVDLPLPRLYVCIVVRHQLASSLEPSATRAMAMAMAMG